MERRILCIGLLLGALLWTTDAALDTLFLPNHTFLDSLLLDVSLEEAIDRGTVLLTFIALGLAVGYLVKHRAGARQRIEYLNAVLRAIRAIDQLIAREHDEAALISRTCTLIAEAFGGYDAWIVLYHDDGTFRAFADSRGAYDASPESALALGLLPSCVERALAHPNQIQVHHPVHGEPVPTLVGDRGTIAGFSKALTWGTRIFGVLNVALPIRYAQDDESQQLFSELADDLSYALNNAVTAERLHFQTLLLDRAEDQLTLTDLEGRILYLNRAQYSSLGRREEELLGQSVEMFGENPERGARQAEILEETVKHGRYQCEVVNVTVDGREILLDCRTWLIKDSQGSPRYICGVSRDITARKLAQAEAAKHSAWLQHLSERVPGFLYQLSRDEHGRYSMSYAGSGLMSLFGVTAESVQEDASAVFHAVHEEDRGALTAAVERSYAKLEVWEGEFRTVLPQGEIRWVAASATPERRPDGAVVWYGYAQDVTERKLAEESVYMSERRLRLLLQDIPAVAVQGYGEDGTVDFWNRASEHFYQYSAEEAIGQRIQDLIIPPEMRDFVGQCIKESAATGVAIPSAELQLMRKDATRIDVFSSHAVVLLPGREAQLYCIDIDLTERKRLEAQLRQAQKMEAVGQLAGGTAHDFNNILLAILGFSQLALQHVRADDEELREFLAEIIRSAERAAALTRQLLAFSRRQILEPKPLDLARLVEAALRMIRRTIGEHIALKFEPAESTWSIHADPGQIEQVLLNLCINARDAMPDGGRLDIETKNVVLSPAFCEREPWAQPGEYSVLVVTDSGCGMDPETLNQVFEPFFTTKSTGEGTGLGLATVYGIVTQHGGFIHVYSALGVGTRFEVYLPRHTSPPEAEPARSLNEDAPGGAERLLVAEDDPALRRLARLVLERAGYHVCMAENGREAIALLKEDLHYDLLLLDVVMPEAGGKEVADFLARHPEGQRPPVLFMSGYSDEGIHTNFILESGRDLIQKPYTATMLLNKVRSMLDSR